MIFFEKLSLSIRDQKIFANCTGHFKKGDIIAITGDNGVGKTLWAKSLAGLWQLNSGGKLIINSNNYDTVDYSRKKAILEKIEYLPQDLPIPITFSVAEFLSAQSQSHPLYYNEHEILKRAKAIADTYKLSLKINGSDKIRKYDRSEIQRLHLIRALLCDPQILILDEPTAHFSPTDDEWFNKMLEILKEKGVVVIIISHPNQMQPSDAEQLTMTFNGFEKTNKISEIRFNTSLDNTRGSSKRFICHLENTLQSNQIQSTKIYEGDIVCIRGQLSPQYKHFVRSLLLLNPEFIKLEENVSTCVIPFNAIEENLAPDLSLIENFILGQWKSYQKWKIFVNRPKAIADCNSFAFRNFNIYPPDLDKTISHFSGGNRQKLIIARAAASRSKLLIACNIFRGLDRNGITIVERYLKERSASLDSTILITNPTSEVGNPLETQIADKKFIFSTNGTLDRQ